MVAIPILTNSIPNQEVVINTDTTSLNLFDHFDDPFTTGLVARFELFNPENTFPNEGVTEVVLFDQADEGAPLTIKNFTSYVEDGDYVNSFIHRSVADFVIQGGGFFIDESPTILAVPTDDPVQNEFSSDRSNLEGTIAMAKLGNDPDSATSQWFFNLGDNSTNINPNTGEDLGLDTQNGGFTAFGELLSDQDAETVNTIAELPRFNLSEQLGGAFNTVPINIENPDNPPPLTTDDFVRYESITISQQEELEFTVTNNSNPELVEAAIEEGELILNYLPDQTGEAEITVQATNLVGETVEDSFSVAVEESLSPQPQPELLFGSSTENDTVEITDAESQNLIFVGAGEDTINNSNSQTNPDRFYGGTENDQLILGGNDRAFGGEGNDILDASIGTGNNRLYGGIGDDDLAVSRNDRAFGGEGNDTLFLTSGGGNILFGGAGNDTFVINAPNSPQSLDTINDFTRGEDQIAFSDDFSDVDFDSLRITPTANGEDTLVGLDNALVRLAGIQADTLTEADFDFTV